MKRLIVIMSLAALLVCGLPCFAYAEDDLTATNNVVNTAQQPDTSFIYETSISELATADSYFDKQIVQITGEVIGDRITDSIGSDYCWITLTSRDDKDDSTVVVYMTQAQANLIDTFGDYAHKGTILQVSGTYHLVCSDHQGVSDVHASAVTIVDAGIANVHYANMRILIIGAGLVGAGALLFVIYRILRERRR